MKNKRRLEIIVMKRLDELETNTITIESIQKATEGPEQEELGPND